MGSLLLLALWAAVYPTLLAMVTIMLMLPQPRRLLAGYLAGAMLMSVTVGMLIVFALGGEFERGRDRVLDRPRPWRAHSRARARGGEGKERPPAVV